MPLGRYAGRIKKMGTNISRKKWMRKNLREVINKIRTPDSDNLPHFRLTGGCQEDMIPENFPFRPKKSCSVEPLDG
jgi:hypothetical protein